MAGSGPGSLTSWKCKLHSARCLSRKGEHGTVRHAGVAQGRSAPHRGHCRTVARGSGNPYLHGVLHHCPHALGDRAVHDDPACHRLCRLRQLPAPVGVGGQCICRHPGRRPLRAGTPGIAELRGPGWSRGRTHRTHPYRGPTLPSGVPGEFPVSDPARRLPAGGRGHDRLRADPEDARTDAQRKLASRRRHRGGPVLAPDLLAHDPRHRDLPGGSVRRIPGQALPGRTGRHRHRHRGCIDGGAQGVWRQERGESPCRAARAVHAPRADGRLAPPGGDGDLFGGRHPGPKLVVSPGLRCQIRRTVRCRP